LNSLLASLLKALHYTVSAHFARVYHGGEFMTKPLHRVNLVHLGDEKLYCDVGFGGVSPLGSLTVTDEIRQQVHGKRFFFRPYSERWLSLYEETEGALQPLLTFDREACLPADFTVANEFGARADIRFRDVRFVSLWSPDGKTSLDGDKLTRIVGETPETKTVLTKRELYNALAAEFGIELAL
jgi:arylamine N-acetyltransferase